MKKITLRGRSDWYLLIIGFGAGILFAFPIAAPILGGVIPDAAATLWGSALGAVMAVAGALWVAERSSKEQQRKATALVLEMVRPIAFFLDELRGVYGYPVDRDDHAENDKEPDPLTPDDWSEVRDAIETLTDQHRSLLNKLHRVDAVLNNLAPSDLATYFYLESEIEGLMESVAILREEASQPGISFYSAPASWGGRFALTLFAKHIDEYIKKLEVSMR
ncbi:MAG: hypothetical protein Q7T66_07105 [Herminiimonas sp.]|nr:hypothetical protein [Herminiimonas sp.]